MAAGYVRLRALLRQRHWLNHRTFTVEYERAARAVDPGLAAAPPSRAQLHRWVSGSLQGLPYGDHCRVLEQMFPGWSAEQLFELIDTDELGHVTEASTRDSSVCTELITSGPELSQGLVGLTKNATRYLVAVGSRSREPAYLDTIVSTLRSRTSLIHYRILIGPPHSQVLKDHLLALVKIGADRSRANEQRPRISIQTDMTHHYERFFVANEHSAIVLMPSANSPINFDTALLVRDHPYVDSLIQHGIALYGKNKLESEAAVNALEVLG